MKLLCLNPTTGNDSAPGDHPLRAVKTCAALNTLVAALSGACADILIDTSNTPSSAPFLPLDATLQFTQPGLRIWGIGHRNVGRSAMQPVPSTGYADILDAKVLVNANFTQPNAGTYPNVWATTDTESKAGFSELRGWTGNSTPLLVYTRVRVATQAAALPLVNTTAGTCWTDGTTMLFHPADGSNPTSNGKTYVRSKPSTHVATSPNGIDSPMIVLGADDIRMENIAVGGALACDYTGGTDANQYAFYISPNGNGRTITVDGLIAHSGGWHLWGINDENATGATNANITVRNAYWTGLDTTASGSSAPAVAYFNGSGASGNTVTLTNVKCDQAVANGTSFFTHGGTNCYDLTVNNPQFASPIGSAAATCRNLVVNGSLALGSIIGSDGDGCALNCVTATFNGVTLRRAPTNSNTTNAVKLRGCLLQPDLSAPGGLAHVNNIDIQFCTLDTSLMPSGASAFMSATTGDVVVFKNNLMLGAYTIGYDYQILATVAGTPTLTFDYNQYAFTSGAGAPFAYNNVNYSFTSWQGLGYDTHSTVVYVGSTASPPSSLGLGTDFFPLSTSAAIGFSPASAGVAGGYGLTWDRRTTAGAYEYFNRDGLRAQSLLPLPLSANPLGGSVGDLLNTNLDDRISAVNRVALASRDFAGAVPEITSAGLDSTAITALAVDTPGTTTLLGRLTSARAGYLDNLNVSGPVASHADIAAINQSASKHMTLATVGQYAPGETYTIEMRTYRASDGASVNADTTPTLTATGAISGSLSGNLSAASNTATGVYRWTYTPGATPTLEQITMDGSATISSATFTLSAYTQTVDQPTATFTATDKSNLTAVFNKLPSGNIADQTTSTAIKAKTDLIATNAADSPNAAAAQTNAATAATQATTAASQATTAATQATNASTTATAIATVLSGITSLAKWLRAGFRKSAPDATALSEINLGGGTYDATEDAQEAIRDHGDAAWLTGSGGSGAGSGAFSTIIHVTDGTNPLTGAHVRISGAQSAGSVDTNAGDVTIALDAGTVTVTVTADGYAGYAGQQTISNIGQWVSSGSSTLTIALTPITIITPSDPGQQMVYATIYKSDGSKDVGVSVSYRITSLPAGQTTGVFDRATKTSPVSDSNGLVQFEVPKGGFGIEVWMGSGPKTRFTTTSSITLALPSPVISGKTP